MLKQLICAAILAAPAAAQAADCPPLKDDPSPGPGVMAETIMEPIKRLGPPPRHLPIPTGPLPSVRISLRRSGCFGTCPIYTVQISGDGRVTYRGERFVLVSGRHSQRIAPSAVACLVENFRRADFWSLRPKYVAPVTDNPLYEVRLRIGGKTKVIQDYVGEAVGMPHSVTLLEREIDRLGARRWVSGDEGTFSALRGEGFDFRSAGAGRLLATAAETASDGLVLSLIDAGAPLATPGWSLSEPGEGATALENAALAGRTTVVQRLLQAGALRSSSASSKAESLALAVRSGNPETVALILAAGADPTTSAPDRDPPLDLVWGAADARSEAKNVNIPAVIELLLKAGASPNTSNREGRTPLHFAGDARGVELLLKAGANIEARDSEGDTPLLTANTDEAAVALIQAGANLKAKGKDGGTVLKLAKQYHYIRALELLRARGISE